MKKNYKYFKYIIPCLIVISIYLLTTLITGTSVFSKNIFMTIDYKHQYYDALVFFRNNYFKNPEYFTYFNGMGLGNEMLGFTNYYISSPLNFLLFLFPTDKIYYGIGLLIYVRITLGAITFRYLIDKVKVSEIFKIIYTVSYIFSGFFIANYFNILWMDIIFILPLFLKGIQLLVFKNRSMLFIFSTTFMIISNFYIGYMLCIYSFILVAYLYLTNKKKLILKDVSITYFLSAILIGLSSIFTLYTSYVSMSRSKGIDSGNLLENPFKILFSPIDFLSKYNMGSNNYEQISNGLPNIWLPLFFVLIVVLMVLDKNISKHIKLKYISLLTVLYLLLNINIFNLILHGFSEPIWFTYRHSFIFTTVLLLISLKYLEISNCLNNFKGIKFWYVYFITANLIIIYALLSKKPTLFYWENILTVIFLFLSYLILFMLIKDVSNKYLVMSLIILLNIFISNFLFIIGYNSVGGTISKKTFSDYTNTSKELETFNLKGRSLLNSNISRLEGLNNGLTTYVTFSSTLNKSTKLLMDRLGVPSEDNMIVQGHQNILTNKLFNVNNLIINTGNYSKTEVGIHDWIDIDYLYPIENKTDNFIVYKNKSLPRLFYSDYNEEYLSEDTNDLKLKNQEDYINNLLGVDYIYFDEIKTFNDTLKVNNTSKDKTDNGKEYYKYNTNNVELNGLEQGMYYLESSPKYFESVIDNSLKYGNNKTVYNNNINGNNFIRELKYYTITPQYIQNNFELNMSIENKNKLNRNIVNQNFKLDDTLYKLNSKNIDKLDSEITKHTPNNLKDNKSGKISLNIDNQNYSLLRSSIPYDTNWKAYNDGKEIEIKNLDTMLAIDIKGVTGRLELEYKVPFLTFIFDIQLLTWAILVVTYSNNIFQRTIKKRD